jgi:hypothetical protein
LYRFGEWRHVVGKEKGVEEGAKLLLVYAGPTIDAWHHAGPAQAKTFALG